MSESIEELKGDIERLRDLVFYHRLIAQAQLGVLLSWAKDVERCIGRDSEAQAERLQHAVEESMMRRIEAIAETGKALADRILALNPSFRDGSDLLRDLDSHS